MPGYLVSEGLLRELREWVTKARNAVQELRAATKAVQSRSPRMVEFRNDASETVPRRGVMRVTGNQVVGNRPTFLTTKPDTTFARRYLVNGDFPVAAGDTGYGTWLTEAEYVSYNSGSGTPAYGEVWGPKSGQWTLEKWRSGFTIQGNTTTVDEVAVVLAVQAHVDLLIGKADAAIAVGASGVSSVWMGVAGSEADTTWNVTAYNRTTAIESGDWVMLTCIHGQWYVDLLECPA